MKKKGAKQADQKQKEKAGENKVKVAKAKRLNKLAKIQTKNP